MAMRAYHMFMAKRYIEEMRRRLEEKTFFPDTLDAFDRHVKKGYLNISDLFYYEKNELDTLRRFSAQEHSRWTLRLAREYKELSKKYAQKVEERHEKFSFLLSDIDTTQEELLYLKS